MPPHLASILSDLEIEPVDTRVRRAPGRPARPRRWTGCLQNMVLVTVT